MKIDFKNEVLKRKDDLIKDLQDLMRINSELTTFDEKRIGAPFGEGNKEALDYMLKLAEKDGFKTVNVDGYAGHIEYGDQKEYVGSIGHLDVVSAGNDWDYPPYQAVIANNRIYGRGAEDDKGPTIAFYYAMKILKELNVPLQKRIKLVIGLDEESGWRCVNHYFKKYPEQPVSGFIPDADFPLIYAEKGIVNLMINGHINDNNIISLKGGFRVNMVPDYATLVTKMSDSMLSNFKKFLTKNKVEGKVEVNNDQLLLTVFGKSAHGSLPEEGINAIDLMFSFLNEANFKNTLIDLYNNLLLNDYKGEKLGVYHYDEKMGGVTNNVGLIDLIDNKYQITLNFRYPHGVDFNEAYQKITDLLKPYKASITYNHHQKLLYNDIDSPLIKTLMDIYIKHTNEKDAKPIAIGGGTFARAMNNTVAYGPHFLDKPSYIHQKNEFIDIDDLMKATIIYTEALYELAK